MVVVVEIVNRPFAGYVGVPIGPTTPDFVKGDLGDFKGAVMFCLVSFQEMPRIVQVSQTHCTLYDIELRLFYFRKVDAFYGVSLARNGRINRDSQLVSSQAACKRMS
jgi:hypothetical protein